MYLLLFIVTLSINFCFLNRLTFPVIYPDSATYLKITDFTLRTPTYPIFLAIFPPIFSVVVASLGTIFLFWIINKLIPNRIITFILTLIICLDYGVVNYQGTLLTESIAPTLILFFLYTNIKIFFNKHSSKLSIIVLLISDLLIMFLKPTFLILPISLNLAYLLFSNKKVLITKIILINIIFILLFLSYNCYRSGVFQISSVGGINSFGLALKNDYFKNQPYYSNAPESVKETIRIFESYNGPTFPNGPYEMLNILKQNNIYQDQNLYLSEVNRYIYIKNKRHFLITLPKKIINNFTEKRQFYSQYSTELINNPSIMVLENFYNYINSLKLIGFLLSVSIFIYLFITKNQKYLILGSILFVCFYTIFFSTVFSYAEYSRLRQPVDSLLNLLVIFPLLYVKFH